MARWWERIDTPLATNMCVTQWPHLAPALEMGAVDVVLSDHHFWGGPRASQELGRFCETVGLGIGMHSNNHLGISMAAMAHVASVIPNLIAACDTHYPWLEQDVLAGGGFAFHGGKLAVPAGPGLGVTVNEEVLAGYHENYQRGVVRERDDTAELLKRDASWLPLSPLW
jgi:glucarate dehydratase